MPSSAPVVAGPRPRSPIKRSDRCPHCNSPRLIKKGTRKKKLERVPILRCLSCGRSFTVGPRPIRNKTYPVNEILEALTLYNRGYSLEETASKISSRFGQHAAASTIARWLTEHPALTTYTRLRARGRALCNPMQTIGTIKLYHRQLYEFSWHRPKLAFVREATLDERRIGSAKFSNVADFIESIPTTSYGQKIETIEKTGISASPT
jgi:transcription elongation factor Elf1